MSQQYTIYTRCLVVAFTLAIPNLSFGLPSAIGSINKLHVTAGSYQIELSSPVSNAGISCLSNYTVVELDPIYPTYKDMISTAQMAFLNGKTVQVFVTNGSAASQPCRVYQITVIK